MGIYNLAPFFLGAIFVITVPGIDTIYTITHSTSKGQVLGIYSAIGIYCGIFVHISIAAFGLSSIIDASAVLYSIIKYIGAGYLLYLGIQALIRKNAIYYEVSERSDEERIYRWDILKKGMLMNILNPKPVLFFFSFLPQFVGPAYADSPVPFFLLGGLFFLMVITWFILSNFHWSGNENNAGKEMIRQIDLGATEIDQKRRIRSLIKDGQITFAGNRKLKIYGKLDCSSGKRMKPENRIFFKSREEAIRQGYRPCGHCMRKQYEKWKEESNQSCKNFAFNSGVGTMQFSLLPNH